MLNCKFSKKNINKTIMVSIFFLLLIFFIVFKPMGFAPDYFQYIYYFDEVSNNGLNFVLEYRFEVGFGILVYLLTFFTASSPVIYTFIVGISSFIKIYIIFLYASGAAYGLAVLLFLFKYFPIQDFNQLRAALSMGFALLYFNYLGKSIYKQVLFFVLAIVFHYSAVLVLPFVYLCRLDLGRVQILVISVLIFIFFKFTGTYILPVFSSYFGVINAYDQIGIDSAITAALSPVFFPEFIALFSLMILWKYCNVITKNIVAIQFFGFAFFYGLIELGVFAVRGREFFSIFWIILVAQYSYSKNIIKYVQLSFVFFSVILGYYLFYYSNFMSDDLRWVN